MTAFVPSPLVVKRRLPLQRRRTAISASTSGASRLRVLPPLPTHRLAHYNFAKMPHRVASAAIAADAISAPAACTAVRPPPARARLLAALSQVKPLARVEQLSLSMRRFRTKHAKRLRYARLAMAAVFGLFAVVAMRRPTSLLASSGTTTAAAATSSAIPAGLLGALPEGLRQLMRPFTESFGVVFLSEFGDKSMFATALMAMKHSPALVLIGALLALTVMTLIACFLGQMMHLLPAFVTHYSTIALFVFFGAQMLMQARSLPSVPGGVGGERADAEALVADSALARTRSQSALSVLAKISSLIFVAEWCDRSMIATMALAASGNSLAVVGGATAANVLCTGMAVGAAALVASRISERTVAIVAGLLFEVFAVLTFIEGPEA